MSNLIIPISNIGEKNWIKKLTTFLEEYGVEVKALENINSDYKIPESMKLYYKHFGGIESSDFMYNLYKPQDLTGLGKTNWSFVKDNFPPNELEKYVVFAESPGNDPVCLNLCNNSIHFFSHDPIKSTKVFENFNQYLIYEIIEIQKLMGDIEFDKEAEINYHKKNLNGIQIDYEFRHMKFC